MFIQYFFYALIYIIDGMRYESLYGPSDGSANKSRESPKKSNRNTNQPEEQKEGGEDEDYDNNNGNGGEEIDAHDIELEQDMQNQSNNSAGTPQ